MPSLRIQRGARGMRPEKKSNSPPTPITTFAPSFDRGGGGSRVPGGGAERPPAPGRRRTADVFDHLGLFLGREVTVPPAGQLHAGIVPCQPAGDALGHARAAAQEVDPLAAAFQGGSQEGEEVGAVDVVADRLAQHFARHPHADAVGEHQVRLLQGLPILGTAASDVHAIGIHEADLRASVAVEPIDDRFDGLAPA